MTVSVPLSARLAAQVDEMVENGGASSKADLIRTALERYLEDEAVRAVLESEQQASEGKILRGDLKKFIKK